MVSDLNIRNNIKKSLINWYSFEEGADILYIGSCEEAWASGITCPNSRIEIKTVEELLESKLLNLYNLKYDYIVLIEKLEYIQNPKDLLYVVRAILKETGVLLLGMNNRLGLRYFCGDRDKYTGRNFDGIENYKRAYAKEEDVFCGKMYSKAEIRMMLENTGFCYQKFYSIISNLEHPLLMFAEGYYPNEDLVSRVFPMYENPETIFLEEENLYAALIDNDIFHQMANAYLVECPVSGMFSDVLQVTSSMDRSEVDAMITIIRGETTNEDIVIPKKVEKIPAFDAGKRRIKELQENNNYLKKRGIKVVDAEPYEDRYLMPYIAADVGQLYLKKLLLSGDKEGFLQCMDHFRDLILKSSEIVVPDKGDGEGAILSKGFLDMVPLNSFYIDGDFVFFDQEFAVENYSANVLLFRMIATFYSGNLECENIIPSKVLFQRYHLMENLEKWRKREWDFLTELRNEKALEKHHKAHRRNGNILSANRQRMNYSQEKYEKLFVNIFEHADTRKLILFGSGNFTRKFISIYGRDYEIYRIIDNNPSKWGTMLDNIQISSPEMLKELNSGEYKVLICIKNYISVMKQLEEMGVGDFSIYDAGRNYPRKLKNIGNMIVQKEEKKKYHIGYVAGAFDMFHVGHLNLLRKAKEQCDYLIVGVIADETILEKKDKSPIIPLEDRVEVVAACRYVDQAEPLPIQYNGIIDAYNMFHFDVQFSGNDHADDEDWQKDREYLNQKGADIVFFDYTEKVSSTMLRQEIID